ncbi:hypothetical protein J2T02_004832 [Chitinophaga terrae (ex Kim and Jung 2007)]|uniref:S41 family peptidase n=1 Tax=Chitinophaga terrae (ex Kim and Jung 2007) TaxID=408074 RepID=UPI00277D8A6A|nr:S41 family peptidase [Chitinophaga terrae (ex Kim and Jung 2007)]MDQ0109688.1 hypothetical protein [Chitinophaga terrae (ex Kim and Jung 2007)]
MKVFPGVLLALLFPGYIAAAQQLSKSSLLEDFSVFQSVFEQANAGLYKYHSKQEVDSAFAAGRLQINDQTGYRDFYNIVWKIVDFTGSCHNQLDYPDAVDSVLNRKKIFFPLPLRYLSGKLYTGMALGNIPLGKEIVSVNGVAAPEFAKAVSRYVSTDGHNETGKYAFLKTNWTPAYIYRAYGEQDSFLVVIKDNGLVRNETLAAVTYKEYIKNYRQRFITEQEKKGKEDYMFRYLDDIKTGVLTVSTFAVGGPESEGHKQYAKFLDSVFTVLQEQNVPDLIVDVRENGGGNDPNDLLLYSYLTRRRFRENTVAFTLFNTVPLKEFYVEEEEDEIKDLEKTLKEENNIERNGKYYLNKRFNKKWRPNPKAFKGQVYLLVSPFVASAGSLFASMVKSDKRPVVIGQETLGGYYGHTGHTPVTYRLPHTGLLLTFSIVDLRQDVRKLRDEKWGDGIMPDYRVEPTIEDVLKGTDREMELAKELIRKKK